MEELSFTEGVEIMNSVITEETIDNLIFIPFVAGALGLSGSFILSIAKRIRFRH